jgi:DNA-binding XRE family transcriptional regulator
MPAGDLSPVPKRRRLIGLSDIQPLQTSEPPMDTEIRFKIADRQTPWHRRRAETAGGLEALAIGGEDAGADAIKRFDRDAMLQVAIGRAVRDRRRRYELNGADLAKAAGISLGVLSRIENGTVSPSLATLHALASCLGISVTDLLCGYREERSAIFFGVSSGGARMLQGSSSCGLKGDGQTTNVSFVHLTEPFERMPMPQHQGIRFLYALDGEFIYRHGPQRFRMASGDSLLCDAALPQEIERMSVTPVRAISLVSFR